jgi:cell fate regulator YaaT (PSP1 superfamily)
MKKEEDYTLRGCASQAVKEGKYCNPHSCNKLNVFNNLRNFPKTVNTPDIIEVRFKNTRKEFFRNINQLILTEGDMVAVESSPGHDIGTVSLAGELVREQMKRKGIKPDSELKIVYRKVKPVDIEKWESATSKEDEVMLKTRQIAKRLNLDMKIGDVEFQGDGTKAIFYYIADHRVDFRELIRILADEFHIRIEMKQIGARQEAGRIGGIGSCGRELCCSSWMNDFNSVTTDTAREQQLSMNPQKLAGQCGKLKCCLNFEKKSYKEAVSEFPPKINLELQNGKARFIKIDVYKKLMWYSVKSDNHEFIASVSSSRVFEIIEMNKKGKKPESLNDKDFIAPQKSGYNDVVGQESITRFDNKHKKHKKRRNNRNKKHSNNKKTNNPKNKKNDR